MPEYSRSSLPRSAGSRQQAHCAGRGSGSGAILEELAAIDEDDEGLARRSLAALLPEHAWYGVTAPGSQPEDESLSSPWLRKLVLQTAPRAPEQAPPLVVDGSTLWRLPSAGRLGSLPRLPG